MNQRGRCRLGFRSFAVQLLCNLQTLIFLLHKVETLYKKWGPWQESDPAIPLLGIYPKELKEQGFGDFPGGAVVKNPPASAGDTGSSPGPGRSHMPRSN